MNLGGVFGPELTWAVPVAIAMAVVLLLPGLLALAAARHPERGLSRFALAIGISIALLPTILWLSTLAGITWRSWGVRAAIAAGLAIAVALAVRGRRQRYRPGPWTAATVGMLAVALLQRAWHARDMVVPPWVDGLHHTLITRLIVDGGRVPQDFSPYLDAVPFYYHFGFHALAATAVWLSDAPVPEAVLWSGQVLNVATLLAAWLLALRMIGRAFPAAVATLVPAALFYFPAYYLSWGRYTQLAGLVALPAALALLDDARRGRGGRRGIVLAAVVAGGMPLVHFRVLVFFVLGALILAAASARRRDVAGLTRMAIVSGGALLCAGPWLLGPVRRGVAALRTADATAAPAVEVDRAWYAWSAEVDALPAWLFTIHFNEWVIAAAACGLVLGVMVGRRGALALSAWLALATLTVNPAWFGWGSSWLVPRFALAISAWLPVAIGLAYGAEGIAFVARGAGGGMRGSRSAAVEWLAAAALVALSAGGAWHLRDIVNPETIIVHEEDLPAASWLAEHSAPDDRVLVATGHWHLGTYRGLDAGYWLPLLADRTASIPPSFYVYGPRPAVVETTSIADTAARGDDLDDQELGELLERAGASWVYVGAASVGKTGAFSASRLRRHPALRERFSSEDAAVFEVLPRD